MKIKRLYLDKHISLFGAVSTLEVGKLRITSIDAESFGCIVEMYDANKSSGRTVMVPWASIKVVELDEAQPKKSKSKKSND